MQPSARIFTQSFFDLRVKMLDEMFGEMLGEMLDRLTTIVGSPNIVNLDVGRNLTEVKMLAAHIQQFYCFEVLGEMLDRLTTAANIVGSAQAQLVKGRQNSIIALLLFSWAGFVRFNN